MCSIVHVVSIIVLASIYARSCGRTPPAQVASRNPRRTGPSGDGSCRINAPGSVRAFREGKPR